LWERVRERGLEKKRTPFQRRLESRKTRVEMEKNTPASLRLPRFARNDR
jgi:hypothetical protein